jgi:ATP-dependent DNA helicase RecQ
MDFQLKNELKKHFGYNDFRPFQEDIIKNILNQQDVVAILPTGSGKSLCYQLPAILLPGTAIIISPLIALMQDQVESLKKAGIKATFINSSMPNYDIEYTQDTLNDYKLVYIAPERLAVPNFMLALKTSQISFFVVDEAHCISQWGHSFRPEYRNLSLLKQEFADKPVSAFTATATKSVAKDITKQLLLKEPQSILGSFDRPNLTLRIERKYDWESQLLTFLARHKEKSGIVYTTTRKKTDEIHAVLLKHDLNAGKYHAGLSSSQREHSQRSFIIDDVSIMVATIAFGMGVHKPNIRYIFHLDMPKNIEQYYQEIGRAGRDGLEAECLMLYGTQDLYLHKKLLRSVENEAVQTQLKRKLEQIFALCSSVNCRRTELLNYFGEENKKENCQACDNCLDEVEQIDGTIIAQKILSCVYRLNQRFGLNYVIDVLVGSKRKKLLNRKHDKLSTYALLTEYPKKELKYFMMTLINMGYLYITEDDYPLLKMTPKTKEILFEKKQIYFRKTKYKENQILSKEVDYDLTLFKQLASLRKEISVKENIPPFVVFHDRTLIEMAAYFPQQEDELIKLNGIGSKKLHTYGSPFIELIKQYCTENKLDSKMSLLVSRPKPRTQTLKGNTLQLTAEMLNQDQTMPEIAKNRGLSERTIADHITQLVEQGKYKNIHKFVSEEKRQKICQIADQIGHNLLSPIKNKLGEDYTWDEIKISLAWRQARKYD